MSALKNKFFHAACNEAGITMVEYALIMALIGLSVVTVLPFIGTETQDTLGCVGAELNLANDPHNPTVQGRAVVCRNFGRFIAP